MSDMEILADRIAAAPDAAIPAAPPDMAMAAGVNIVRPGTLAVDSVTQEQINLSRMIRRGLSITLAPQDAWLRLHLAPEAEIDPAATLVLKGSFGAIELAQGPRFLRALAGIDLSAELSADDARWDWLQTALLARLEGTPFAGAERLVRSAPAAVAGAATLRLALHTASHVIVTYARADAVCWLNFLQQAAWTRLRLPLSNFMEIPYEVSIHAAHHTLPLHALKELAEGDIIVPNDAVLGVRGTGFIQIGGMRARVRHYGSNTFKISELEFKPDESSPVDEPVPDTDPVTLDFELGKLRMPLAEVHALRRDSLVAYSGSPSSVAIRCNGRLLGRGELLSLDKAGGNELLKVQQLAVRLVEWNRKCESS